MKITESITAHLNMKEITDMIEGHALKEGYQVVKITPEYDTEYSKDPKDYGSSGTRVVTGFKVDLKRKPEPIKRNTTPPPRDWFDVNDR